MFNLTLRELNNRAEQTLFQRDTLEKVLRLGDVLWFLNTTELLKDHLVLKGGTAIHLTVFPMLRLSVDIDLDFHASVTREEMIEIRKQVTNLITRYMSSQRYQLSSKSKYTHTLDSFIFNYTNLIGNPDNITVEINYSNRCHLFDPTAITINTPVLNGYTILSVSKMDLFGSKISAMLDRTTPRDVYDVYQMIMMNVIQPREYELLKKSALFYLSLSIDNLDVHDTLVHASKRIAEMSYQDIKRTLMPVLKRGESFDIASATSTINDFFSTLFVITTSENKYLELFAVGIYTPRLLFSDDNIINRIEYHPMALWKAQQRQTRSP